MSAEPRRGPLVIMTAVVLVIILACSATCLAGPIVLPRLPLPFGYLMGFCAVWQTAPHFQVGIYWASPYFSYVPPSTPKAVGCVILPWLPVLPQRGGVLFP